MAKNKSVLKVGVTGGIGSGKSTFCNSFTKMGVPVLFADDISKKICVSDEKVKISLKKLFGESAYNPDGSLNRQLIAEIIFKNKSLRRKMEMIVHPKVKEEISKKINELAKSGKQIVLVEAALIYEANLDKVLDVVVFVDANEAERINRICKRDLTSEESVRSRILAQLNLKKNLKKADFVINNDGSIEELECKAQFLYNVFNKIINEGKK